jgi:predicted kinase
MLIVMAGLPGAGKSTLAEIVGARRKIIVLSVDQIETAVLKAGISAGQPTGLAAYLVAETLAESALVRDRDIIIDAVNAVDPDQHRARLVDRAAKREQAGVVERSAVEQSLDEYSPWTGTSGAIARITLDSVGAIGVNVDRTVAFLDA